ncbi:response regulator, partial [Globicatella sulfidifaciens]
MKILIVEDDKIIARQLKVELEKWQYQVALIEDFTKVIEEFKAFEPHLVLMDIGLPAFNGYHWCQQIRQFSK